MDRSFVDTFPVELLQHLVSRLDPASAAAFRQVNFKCRTIVDSVPLLAVKITTELLDTNDSNGPAGVCSLKILSARSASHINANLSAVQSVEAIADGVHNDLLRTIVQDHKSLRKLTLRVGPKCALDDLVWLKSLPKHTHLSELVLDGSFSVPSLGRRYLEAVKDQLRVLTVRNTGDLGGLEFSKLHTLTVSMQPHSFSSDTVVHHEPTASPGSVLLRMVTQHSLGDGGSHHRYGLSTRHVSVTPGARVTSSPNLAPKLKILTISYPPAMRYANAAALPGRFALPSGLSYHQVTDLTLVNAKMHSWADLFVLPLAQAVRVSLYDTAVEYDYESSPINNRTNLQPPVDQVLPVAIPMWCVLPNLCQLLIRQSHASLRSFSLHGQTLMVLNEAFPALKRLDLVDSILNPNGPINQQLLIDLERDANVWIERERAINDKISMLLHTCRSTLSDSIRYVHLSQGNSGARYAPDLVAREHRTTFHYVVDDQRSAEKKQQNSSLDVSYKLLDAEDSNQLAMPCSRCTFSPAKIYKYTILSNV